MNIDEGEAWTIIRGFAAIDPARGKGSREAILVQRLRAAFPGIRATLDQEARDHYIWDTLAEADSRVIQARKRLGSALQDRMSDADHREFRRMHKALNQIKRHVALALGYGELRWAP